MVNKLKKKKKVFKGPGKLKLIIEKKVLIIHKLCNLLLKCIIGIFYDCFKPFETTQNLP